ncbi:MAG: phosphoenolpyruvate carboxykinase (GTP) [Candidatus Heimdallarchaeum aukensis]|uniref:Phosphoenolpyruvate carboxykinase [GTP] n=1 Tax=Candidatus Heimdallarchaeum aukensis TaxID=2876573 RepID=A0A9Y1BJE8_9ARCH|nr:MAG: phosphoenolpyruvate carboxykinase (GTP) [Candidatus Heimdallarchaeum aukensis]
MALEKWLSKKDIKKLEALNNPKVIQVVEEFFSLCKPEKGVVIDDSDEDINYVRKLALELGEEKPLDLDGHTIHFDSYYDQARDKANTRLLVPAEKKDEYGKHINTIDRNEGLKEILSIMDGCMKGKLAIIRFFCLGPTNSDFSISALQITDSAYVAHSEDILYRKGYEQFKRLKDPNDFFYFIHSAGPLTDKNVTKNIDKRRIYIDLEENRVLSVNNQYAGNSLGLKKLALRLAINKAINEGWLTEHMFISAVIPPKKNRKTYFLGAFPSACGKTSTAMIPGNSIVGDDIAYLRINKEGEVRAVNIESGIFGIIRDVNPKDDPEIYKALTTPGETIFSNVLVKDGKPYWLGMGDDIEIPKTGTNWTTSLLGDWEEGKKDEEGNELKFSHPNARYTIRIEDLENCDEALNDPEGVKVSAIIYGGRDSDTSVPVYESFDWNHGVFVGASVESETTAATLGKAGVRKHQPMANLDFIVVPLGKYLKAHYEFGKKVKEDKRPKIFSTNYFLKDENNKYYDEILDKKIWLLWAESRVHNECEAIETPIGYIPKYEDLAKLFKDVFNIDYSKERYEAEFSIRVDKFLEKLDRIEAIFKEEKMMPEEFFIELNNQRKRLLEAKEKYKTGIISPFSFLN